MTTPAPAPRLQLRVALKNVAPPIWRRIIVDGGISFAQLHVVIQRAMGWHDAHLHEFIVGEQHIGAPAAEDFFDTDDEIIDESTVRVADAVGSKRKFRYWYDFGDDWWHEIAVEKRLPADPDAPPATLVDGARACPPEDCGGPWGYAELLEALADADHPDHDDMMRWIGPIDPERFDPAVYAKRVAAALLPRKPRPKKKP
jgi:hypothetical protein